jgi:hypothetical protein
MKAIITQKSELDLNLQQSYTFDILEGDETILTSQSVRCSPSQAQDEIRAKVAAYEVEYQLSAQLEEGTEIN